MNKEQIKSKMQSIEESIKEQTNELNKLRAEMDKPEKPTIEEMCKGKTVFTVDADGTIDYDYYFRTDAYLSRERAEKELLRIKLSVIADHFNGGLFEPKKQEAGFYIAYDQINTTIIIGNCSYTRQGHILFKTREHAELAMTYFTNDELIKMLI